MVKRMNGLDLLNDQIAAVNRHVEDVDWSRHDETMRSLDIEVGVVNQTVRTLLFLHQLLVETDALITSEIEAGKMPADAIVHRGMITAIENFSSAATKAVRMAGELVVKGIPINGFAALKRIAADPGSGLIMLEMATLSKELDSGANVPTEVQFTDRARAAAAAAGKEFRHLGND